MVAVGPHNIALAPKVPCVTGKKSYLVVSVVSWHAAELGSNLKAGLNM